MHRRQDFPSPFSFYVTVMLETSELLLSYVGVIELSIWCLKREGNYALYLK